MYNEEPTKELRDMDFILKEKIVEVWYSAVEDSANGNMIRAFQRFKSLFMIISPYDFTTKKKLEDMTNGVQEYIDSLGGKPLNERDLIEINQRKYETVAWINEYMFEVTKGLVELNLWLKTTLKLNDFDVQHSEETFNSDISTLKEKKEILAKLESKELLKLFTKNSIHKAHAKHLWENAE